MAHISVLLVPENGKVRRYGVSRRALRWAAGGMLVVLLAVGLLAWLGWDAQRNVLAERQRAQALAERLARVQAEKTRLAQALRMEQKKAEVFARRIGEMQARLARLDLLGQRLVEVAGVDDKGFDFSEPPAFGGASVRAEGESLPVLDDLVARIDEQAGLLDAELAVIEAEVMERHSEQALRPHAWPTEGGWISSGFGKRIDPFTGAVAPHRGVDIANHYGAPVFAASAGVVVFAGRTKDFGYLVEIDHGYGYRTRYGHLSAIQVHPGDLVQAGQLIGRIGSSGRSTGPHLHYEVRYFGRAVDPRHFLPKS